MLTTAAISSARGALMFLAPSRDAISNHRFLVTYPTAPWS
jgi:hypothetical protein